MGKTIFGHTRGETTVRKKIEVNRKNGETTVRDELTHGVLLISPTVKDLLTQVVIQWGYNDWTHVKYPRTNWVKYLLPIHSQYTPMI